MAGLSCALSGASCCVLPTYFEATRFLSGYCGALHCVLFSVKLQLKTVQISILIFLPVPSACTSAIITFVRASLREWRRDRYRTGQPSTNDVHTSLEKKNNCDLVHHQHFRLVSSTKVKIDLVIVFIYKDPFSSCLSLVLVTGKRSLTNIFRHSFPQRDLHWCEFALLYSIYLDRKST